MGDYSDSKQTGRILVSEAGQTLLREVQSRFLGRTITGVHFSNEIQDIGVTLHLDTGDSAQVFLRELTLLALMDKPDIAAQERELYYQEYPDRRPKTKEGGEHDGKQDES